MGSERVIDALDNSSFGVPQEDSYRGGGDALSIENEGKFVSKIESFSFVDVMGDKFASFSSRGPLTVLLRYPEGTTVLHLRINYFGIQDLPLRIERGNQCFFLLSFPSLNFFFSVNSMFNLIELFAVN